MPNIFEIDDIVRVEGYKGLYRVVETSHHLRKGETEAQEYYTYTLIATETYMIIKAEEDKISLITRPCIAEKDYKIEWQKFEDYMTLFEMTGDEEYREEAKRIFLGLNKKA